MIEQHQPPLFAVRAAPSSRINVSSGPSAMCSLFRAGTGHEHVNSSRSEAAVLISFTDEPLLKSLGIHHEEGMTPDRS
jgi:hypothetical protein